MYEDLEGLRRLKPSKRIPLWRYMSFAKWVDMLARGTLWFTRVDTFEDPYEGIVPASDRQALAQRRVLKPDPGMEVERVIFTDYRGNPAREATPEEARQFTGTEAEFAQVLRKHTFVNCWHANEGESAAMWGLYTQQGNGIAVTTTFDHLVASLEPEPRPVNIAKIQYTDPRTASIRNADGSYDHFRPSLIKRPSFAHEREVRAFIINMASDPATTGMAIACDLGVLIQRIYVDPRAKPWFYQTVCATARTFKVQTEPKQSDLYSDPLA